MITVESINKLSQAHKADLNTDAIFTSRDRKTFNFIWGHISDIPLNEGDFENTDDKYMFFYFSNDFKSYILLEKTNTIKTNQRIKFIKDGIVVSNGVVGKIDVLSPNLKYHTFDATNRSISNPIAVTSLSNLNNFKFVKDPATSTPQGIWDILNLN